MRPNYKSFAGGTLVEYRDGALFKKEWGRANILEVVIKGHEIRFVTDGKAFYESATLLGAHPNARQDDVREKNGVIYIIPAYTGVNYAIAPKGVNIPTPWEREFDPIGLFWN